MTGGCIICANGNDLPDGEHCRACGRACRSVLALSSADLACNPFAGARMTQIDWKTVTRPATIEEIMEVKTKDAVFAAKVAAAHVLADEIKRRKAAVNALKKFVHYESWMDRHGDDVQVSTFKRHTFGDLRKAKEIIDNE
jgi:hypothetical protein